MNKILRLLNEQPFAKALLEKGEVFLVGGIVRDSILNKNSKDIDLLVTGIPINQLEKLLSQFGRVDLVGNSFGVLKFKPNGMDLAEPIDIAIPRTEVKNGVGHKDFKVIASHDIPIEMDLKRRDFTCNSIAMKLDGTVIDPFNGREDLTNGVLRMVDEVAFNDDPLRMLRAVQFSSRFALTVDPTTFKAIRDSVGTIKSITVERVLIELDKIQKKGDAKIGFDLLVKTGLFEQIFGFEEDFSNVAFEQIKSRGDFFSTLLRSFPDKSDAFLKILKGDIETAKELKAIQFGFENASLFIKQNRAVAFDMFKISKLSFDSGILPNALKRAIEELKNGHFPKTLSELAVNGDDLIELGFKGREIGDMLSMMLKAVLEDKCGNRRNELLNLIKDDK